ncbi:bifunctional metallophosphatase/5'-nucleotidase [Marinomonas sp.]|nr:bifunctional metallophosphatase/5'-nucleotidase [Marinomonas sp.]MDB4837854.1 bifunctional metallophosphatase/5'-nucleotidase [Marinomonas sp.]
MTTFETSYSLIKYIRRLYKYSFKSILKTTSFLLIALPVVAYGQITFVYTSNQPNILFDKDAAHFPQLSTLLNDLRSKKETSTLFLQGGDNFAPSAISMFDNASNIIALANIMETSLYSVGKRELVYDIDVLSLRAHEAQFPIVSSNLRDIRTGSEVEGLFNSYDFDIEGTNISVASLINKRVIVAYGPKNADLANSLVTLDNIIENQKEADLKILMTDLEEEPSLKIAEAYDFDIIFVAIDGPDRSITVNDTLVVFGGGQDGDTILVNYDPNKTPTITSVVEPLNKYLPDPKILGFIKKYENRITSLHNDVIAVTKSKFTTKKNIIRTRETALANIFADAIRDKAQTQIAILNSGAIRNSKNYPVDYQITRGDIQSELPFGGHHVSVELNGATIIDMMENSLSRIEHQDGRFLNVSGMSLIYDSSAPIGQRVQSIKINQHPLDIRKTYSVAIPSFYAQGGDDYSMLMGLKTIDGHFNIQKTWHVIAQYLAERKFLKAGPLERMVNVIKHEN